MVIEIYLTAFCIIVWRCINVPEGFWHYTDYGCILAYPQRCTALVIFTCSAWINGLPLASASIAGIKLLFSKGVVRWRLLQSYGRLHQPRLDASLLRQRWDGITGAALLCYCHRIIPPLQGTASKNGHIRVVAGGITPRWYQWRESFCPMAIYLALFYWAK